MRFSVGYKLNKLDLTYRMQVYSLIKEAIRLSSKEYYEQMFIQQNKQMKLFSFATYLKNFTINDSTISLDEIIITISSPSIEFATHCFNGLLSLKNYQTGEEVWKQTKIQLLKERSIFSRKVVFKTLSPILIEDKTGTPLGPQDKNYEQELNYYANLQINQYAGRDLFEPLKFKPIDYKRLVVKEKNRHIHQEAFLYFTTYKGVFSLQGHPNDLQLIYQLGLGKRNTYFGLLDYVTEEVQYDN